jgi:hypothetical protein
LRTKSRDAMARRKSTPKTVGVRLSEEAARWAKIASGYTDESMAEYVSRVVAASGKADADRLHAEATRDGKGKGGPKP